MYILKINEIGNNDFQSIFSFRGIVAIKTSDPSFERLEQGQSHGA